MTTEVRVNFFVKFKVKVYVNFNGSGRGARSTLASLGSHIIDDLLHRVAGDYCAVPFGA